jgi:hypothetical protein
MIYAFFTFLKKLISLGDLKFMNLDIFHEANFKIVILLPVFILYLVQTNPTLQNFQ